MIDLEGMARELLRDACDAADARNTAKVVASGNNALLVQVSVAAIRAALLTAPPGWKLVPVESDEDMQYAATDEQVGGHCHLCSAWDCTRDDARRVWDAMIAAAPQPKDRTP